MRSELQNWLDSVTGVFPHATAARLRRELELHAEDTALALRAKGQPDPEAAALHAMGEAREVRRRLEEAYFTRAEVDWLRQDSVMRRALERGLYPGGWWRFFSTLAAVLVLLFLPLINLKFGGTFSWTNTLVYWGFAVTVTLIERLVMRRFSGVAAVILWRLLGLLSIPFWLVLTRLLFGFQGEHWVSVLLSALVSCVVVWFLRPQAAFALLPKALRNAI